MPDTKDSLKALLQQEKLYACPDYLNAAAGNDHDHDHSAELMHMVEECANVVTDKHFSSSSSSSSSSPKSTVTKSRSMQDVRDVDKLMQSSRKCRNKSQSPSSSATTASFRFWRQQMFDWSCMVMDSFGMDREIVAVSFALLDRYVATESANSQQAITRDDFQLFSMTCLYLVVKILEPYPRKLGVKVLVDMSRGFYTEEDIVVTEREILASLGWHLHPPTAVAFARFYWDLFPRPVCPSAHQTSTTLTEIAVSDAFFVSHKPSMVGLAAVMIAARLHEISDGELQQFLTNLEEVLPMKENPEFAAVYRQLELLYS